MKMYKADGSYWQTLLSPNPAPHAIEIGPWIFVKDETAQVLRETPPGQVSGDIYRGPVSYVAEEEK